MLRHNKGITLKYLVIGDSGVGKSSILVRYCDDSFKEEYLSTIGVDFKIKKIQFNNQSITLNIWDTAGQQRFRNITKSFYKGAHGIVLAYSIIDALSFQHMSMWIQQIREVDDSSITMILVGTKCDLQNERKVSIKQGEDLAIKYQLKFLQVSAKDGTNIYQIFYQLTSQVIQYCQINVENNSLGLVKKQDKIKKQCC